MSDIVDMDLGMEVAKSVAARFVQAVLGFAGTILFARILGPTGFGGFYLLLTVVELVDRPFNGWSAGVTKRFSEHASDRREVMGAQVGFNVVGLGVALLMIVAGHEYLVAYSGLDQAGLMFLVLLGSMVFFYPFQNLLDATGRVGLSTWNDTLRSVLTLGLQLALVLANLGAAGMAYGLAGATVGSSVVTYYYLRIVPRFPSRETVRSVARFAKYSVPNAIVGKAYDRFDVLLIGFLLSPATVGYYEVAAKLTIPTIFVSGAIQQGLMPKISNLASRGEDVADDVTNSLAFGSVLAVPVFFGALAIPRPLVVTAYGSDYAAAAGLLVGIALYRIFSTQTQILRNTLEGLDRPNTIFRISTVTLGFNVVLGYALVLELGAIGAVIATVLAEALRYSVIAHLVRRLLPDVEILPRPLLHQVAAGVVMFAGVEGLRRAVPIESWFTLLVVVGVGAVIYCVALVGISPQFRTAVRNVAFQFRESYGDRRSG